VTLTADFPQQVVVDDWHLQAQLAWVQDLINIQSLLFTMFVLAPILA